MRLSKVLLLLLFCALCFAPRASAQGCIGLMTPNFSSYVTFSMDSNLNIYSTVLVDGYASIHPSEYCLIPEGTYHRGQPYNMLGSTGGYVTGPEVCPSCYISVTNSQDIPGVPGVLYTDDADGIIYCSAIGDLYDVSFGLQVETAHEYTASSGVGTCIPNPIPGGTGYQCTIPQTPWCQNCITTNPPGPGGIVPQARDMNITALNIYGPSPVVPAPYYRNAAVCVRPSKGQVPGGWACTPLLAATPIEAPIPFQECTYYPYQM